MARQAPGEVEKSLAAAYQKKVVGAVVLVVKKIAVEVFSGVVEKSPVDTGRFRGNWQTGVATRPEGTSVVAGRTPRKPTEPFRTPEPVSAGELRAALAPLSQMNTPQTAYIVNNLPYADALENGHSQQQAPQGMVAVTVAGIKSRYPQIVKAAVQAIPGGP